MDKIRRCLRDMNSLKVSIAQQRTERSVDEVKRCLLEMHFLRFSIAKQRADRKPTEKTDSQLAVARARETLQWLERTLVEWKAKQSDTPDHG